MSEKENKIMDTIGELIPTLTDLEKEKLIAFGEGMAFMKAQQEQERLIGSSTGE